MRISIIPALAFMVMITMAEGAESGPAFPRPQIEFHPRVYLCPRSKSLLIINGVADEPSWDNAPWSDNFVDIEGGHKPEPQFKMQVETLWSD